MASPVRSVAPALSVGGRRQYHEKDKFPFVSAVDECDVAWRIQIRLSKPIRNIALLPYIVYEPIRNDG